MLAVAALQRVFPCRRMRRPRRVVKTPVPPAIRHAGRIRRPGTGHDIGSLRRQRTRPRATACCQLHARLFARPARCPARRSAMAVEESPPFARDRDVAPSALAARRPLCRAIAARHVQHLPVPPQTPDASSGDAPGGSDWGRLYHAVITAALTACLADPLPHKARRPLSPPVTTPFPQPDLDPPAG